MPPAILNEINMKYLAQQAVLSQLYGLPPSNVSGIRYQERKELKARIQQHLESQIGTVSSWWFQPVWKILVKMGIFPK